MNIRFEYEAIALPERYRGAPQLNLEQCISCGLCVAICPNKALKRILVDQEFQTNFPFTYPRVNVRKCCFCGLCQDICPVGAIRMTKHVLLATKEPAGLITGPTPKYAD